MFRDPGAIEQNLLMEGDSQHITECVWRPGDVFKWSTIMHGRTTTTEENDDCVLDHEPRKNTRKAQVRA